MVDGDSDSTKTENRTDKSNTEGPPEDQSKSIEQYVDDIVDCLDSVSSTTGYNTPKVFREWIDLCVYSLEGDNDRYLSTLDRITSTVSQDSKDKQDVASELAEAFAIVCVSAYEHQQPILGDVYHVIGANSESLGQYFTPWNVCESMAKMKASVGDIRERDVDDPLTVHDPACGSSRMQIASAKEVFHIRPELPVIISGVDKSETCAKMSVINIALAGQSGWIAHGDSLTMEMNTKWTIDSRSGSPIIERVDNPQPNPTENTKNT